MITSYRYKNVGQTQITIGWYGVFSDKMKYDVDAHENDIVDMTSYEEDQLAKKDFKFKSLEDHYNAKALKVKKKTFLVAS